MPAAAGQPCCSLLHSLGLSSQPSSWHPSCLRHLSRALAQCASSIRSARMATSSSTYARARHGSASSQFHASRSSRKCCSQSRGDRCMARGRVASGEVCCFILCGWNHFRLGLCDYPTVSLHAYRPFHRRVPSVVSSLAIETSASRRSGTNLIMMCGAEMVKYIRI